MNPTPNRPRQFASDNQAGICPEALERLLEANGDHQASYGDDRWTQRACDLFRELFETDCEVYFVLTGTAGNGLALASLCEPYHSVICHRQAHIETDECGAPEFLCHGTKLWLGDGADGKLDPATVTELVTKRSDIHYPKPRVVSLTQATELGTVYAPAELTALRETADRHELRVHMDGARFANAVAALGVPPRRLAQDAGVDVLCFGGSKNGTALGEALIFFDRSVAAEFDYRCKQAGQLLAKMRFVAAPWVGLLESGAWRRNAEHANRLAARLERGLRETAGVRILFPRQANAVFAGFPPGVEDALHARGWRFYNFIGVAAARLMCAWDTTDADVDAFIADVQDSLAGRGRTPPAAGPA